MSVYEDRAADLFDLLVQHAEGMTWEGIAAETGWTRGQVVKTVQSLRDVLGDADTISVTCAPQGEYEPWVYQLQAGNQITDAEKSVWVINRIGDAERRLKTIKHVLEVAVKATDGRTMLGRKARVFEMHIRHAEEQIALLDDTGT